MEKVGYYIFTSLICSVEPVCLMSDLSVGLLSVMLHCWSHRFKWTHQTPTIKNNKTNQTCRASCCGDGAETGKCEIIGRSWQISLMFQTESVCSFSGWSFKPDLVVFFLDCGVLMPCFHLISELGSGNALTLGENWCELGQVEAWGCGPRCYSVVTQLVAE